MVRTKKAMQNEGRVDTLLKSKRVALGDIEIAELPEDLAFVAQLRLATKQSPALKSNAARTLEYVRPLVLAGSDGGARRYRLIAGRETFQLLVELYPLSHKVFALFLPEVIFDEVRRFQVFDWIVGPILSQITPEDIGIFEAALLESRHVRTVAGEFIKVDSDADIADVFGVSRATLHRRSKAFRDVLRKKSASAHAAPKEQLSLEIEYLSDEGQNVER